MQLRRYRQHPHRQQLSLFPDQLDDHISKDNTVRAIDAYIDTLDLTVLGFAHTQPGSSCRGQPAYDPAGLLKLYLYGYLNGIRSSRKLERECRRNLELIWLLEHQTPSYKTIANFRKDNPQPLTKVNRDFLLLCRSLELVGGEVVAIDGSFFRGNASKSSIITRNRLTQQLKKLELSIEQYHQALNEQDRLEAAPPTSEGESLVEKLARLETQKQQLDQQLAELQACDETQLSRTDSDARLLSKSGQRVAGYNIQAAVDEKHKLIVASDVTHDGNDQHQLSVIALQVKEALQVDSLTVLADAGYFESEQIRQCSLNAITPYVPLPDKHRAVRSGQRYSGAEFQFDADLNQYLCPAEKRLQPQGELTLKNNKLRQRYISQRADCDQCPLRQNCLTPHSRRRQLYRWEHEDCIDQHRARMKRCSQQQMKLRASLVEHPFGTLKHRAGWSHFLLRGFEKVRGEWALMVTGYNLTRVLNILGINDFIKYCGYLKDALYRLFTVNPIFTSYRVLIIALYHCNPQYPAQRRFY